MPNTYVQSKHRSWEEFVSRTEYFSSAMGFVFRGHRCSDWTLDTTLDRLIKRINPQNINLSSTYDYVLNEFKRAIRGKTLANKTIGLDENEIWALGQHHGLATPLLDWSVSMYAAAFFAFSDPQPSPSGFRTVWALHSGPYMKSFMEKYNEGLSIQDQFKFIDPISDHNPRLIAQDGIFTRQPLDFDLVDWVKQINDSDTPYLIKMDIPDSERLKALSQLRLMNVHHRSLFPDLNGAAEYCNSTLELLSEKRKREFSATASP